MNPAMKLEDNLRDSFSYAAQLFRRVGRLILLIVLNIIPIVNFIVLGYFARVVKESPGSREPPPLERYGDLWVSGAKVFVASLVYVIVPAVLIGIGYASMTLRAFLPLMGLGILGVSMLVAGAVLMFLVMIVAIMAIVNMVKTGRIGGAFEFSRIFSVIRGVGWGTYIAWILVIFVIGLIISGIYMIPLAGWIIALIISPIFMVFVGRSASIVYESGASRAAETKPPTGPVMYCGYCGAPLSPEDKFCGRCGRPVK